ncbi:hypothetical protein [Pseudoroseicyclus aestuarii]|uniref:Alanine-rich protein SCI7.12c n=1 Tax=Pseudoroseicyclus aestuarii TaxID=1795041 RepID=A0A318SWS3_9RHOB|nr:hypothetical protein [Pseudoroseicyclus aestuarii]PYE85913.1 hypothetical protein DFP88_101587 [Pseudoroseicyclus aestuarii]
MSDAVWSYAWDLQDIGLEEVARRTGGRGVSLATSYHAGRFLQPGNPRRRSYFPQDGTVYWQVDPARWRGAEIAPVEADIVATEGDKLGALIARRDAGGPEVAAWCVCLHNTRAGMAHPEHVTRTAFGDPNFYALCPSSPAARAYVTGMVAEIAERYAPDRIELESPDFLGFAHGYHHEKDGLGLLEEDLVLLGLCFCEHCHARASEAGVDLRAAQERVTGLLEASFAREMPEAQFASLAELAALPELAPVLAWRSEPVTSLIAEAKAAAGEVPVYLIDAEGSAAGGVDRAAAAAACDGLVFCAYDTPAERLGPLLAQLRQEIGTAGLRAGLSLGLPQVAGPADLRARVAAARPHVEGINFYNLGLVPAARWDWLAGH